MPGGEKDTSVVTGATRRAPNPTTCIEFYTNPQEQDALDDDPLWDDDDDGCEHFYLLTTGRSYKKLYSGGRLVSTIVFRV